MLKHVGEVVREGCGMTWDGLCIAVGMPRGEVGGEEGVRGMNGDEWEDLCQEWGFEWVDWELKGRNEYSGMFSRFFVPDPGLCTDELGWWSSNESRNSRY